MWKRSPLLEYGQLFFLHDGVFKIRTRITISRPETPKRVISQTVKTLMKFHQGLHCLTRQNRSSEKEIQYCYESLTCHPLIMKIPSVRNGLTGFSIVSFLWDIDKQCRTRSDAAERGV